ncbi:hypothetical protein [Cellulomonas composti]|uniref:Uncharacterized protein n=1 Tax=Cellulomonas composti TaxID=266130 RepID=A0A511JEP3_9CELL|nr:hypothetical protein [Cellulomonas composti]GEL96435.1 hypothetical protein CCO02nite_30930 [Cellulomonas composti]
MASWRDTASQQAQDDLDDLLSPALGFAQQQLDAHGEFYPYAVVLDHDSQQRMVAADIGSNRPESADLITALIAALSDERDQLRAAAIVADVRVRELGSDAIRVTLEHSERIALTILLPYRPRRFGRGIDYGDLQAGPAAAFVWPAD